MEIKSVQELVIFLETHARNDTEAQQKVKVFVSRLPVLCKADINVAKLENLKWFSIDDWKEELGNGLARLLIPNLPWHLDYGILTQISKVREGHRPKPRSEEDDHHNLFHGLQYTKSWLRAIYQCEFNFIFTYFC